MTRVFSYLSSISILYACEPFLVRYNVFIVYAHTNLSLRDKYQNLVHWPICFRFGVTKTCVKIMDKKKSEI